MKTVRGQRGGERPGTGNARDAAPKVVLVGTYKGDQLSAWRGWYCWPMSNEELKMDTGEFPAQGFSKVNELWLFQGTKEQRNYTAEFMGIKTREELVRDY